MTATSYTFWIPKEDGTHDKITQSGNTYPWEVDVYGTWTVYGEATDGTDTAYDIDGIDVTSVHVPTPYSRPGDWITIPTINVGGGEEVVYALMAVWDVSHNYVAFFIHNKEEECYEVIDQDMFDHYQNEFNLDMELIDFTC